MTTKIVVAVVACDYKAYSLERVVNNNLALESPPGVELLHYLNLERSTPDKTPEPWMLQLPWEQRPQIDMWHWDGGWRPQRGCDQDQGHRLPPIVIARNMALEYAKYNDADAVLYVDSDVVVPPNSAVELWRELDAAHGFPVNIVGGLVPGRGIHSHVYYTGSQGLRRVAGREHLGRTDYGTAGFVMIHRDVWWGMCWRWGSAPGNFGPHSEDPLFAHDARQLSLGWWYIRTDLKAEHLDNPEQPLDGQNTGRWV